MLAGESHELWCPSVYQAQLVGCSPSVDSCLRCDSHHCPHSPNPSPILLFLCLAHSDVCNCYPFHASKLYAPCSTGQFYMSRLTRKGPWSHFWSIFRFLHFQILEWCTSLAKKTVCKKVIIRPRHGKSRIGSWLRRKSRRPTSDYCNFSVSTDFHDLPFTGRAELSCCKNCTQLQRGGLAIWREERVRADWSSWWHHLLQPARTQSDADWS